VRVTWRRKFNRLCQEEAVNILFLLSIKININPLFSNVNSRWKL
jgi:hypothetical protein